jgi:glycoprotein-N-acetylgalactosamine 3-beta-galactosyltransferase
MTTPNQHENNAKHVKATWGKRCDILYFVSTVVDETLPSISINMPESRETVWHKSRLDITINHANDCKLFWCKLQL